MSYREINRLTTTFESILRGLGIESEDVDRVSEVVIELMREIAQDEIDRLFNRGDYQS